MAEIKKKSRKGQKRKNVYNWAPILKDYLTGVPVTELSKKWGPTTHMIHIKKKRDNWELKRSRYNFDKSESIILDIRGDLELDLANFNKKASDSVNLALDLANQELIRIKEREKELDDEGEEYALRPGPIVQLLRIIRAAVLIKYQTTGYVPENLIPTNPDDPIEGDFEEIEEGAGEFIDTLNKMERTLEALRDAQSIKKLTSKTVDKTASQSEEHDVSRKETKVEIIKEEENVSKK